MIIQTTLCNHSKKKKKKDKPRPISISFSKFVVEGLMGLRGGPVSWRAIGLGLGLIALCIAALSLLRLDPDDEAPDWAGIMRRPAAPEALAKCIDVFFENDDEAMWEGDFLYKDVLSGYELVKTKWNHKKLRSDLELDISVVNDKSKRCAKIAFILHARRNEHCPAVRRLWEATRPDLVFLLSDEYGAHRCYDDVSAETARVVLRQYSVRKYGWTEHRNAYHMMLGAQGFHDDAIGSLPMKPPSERKFVWTFSGNRKSDRVYMTTVLAQHLSPHKFVWHGMKPVEMVRDLYFESMFVPVGRGGQSLDCFRMYEACRAGAIPIVVGPREEIVKTFSTFLGYEERLPMFVFADTWSGAVRSVKLLMSNRTLLHQYHEASLEFWSRSLEATRRAVETALGPRRGIDAA